MTLKKTLKPTPLKIVVLIILLLAIVPFFKISNPKACPQYPCEHEKDASLLTYLSFDNKGAIIHGINFLNLLIGVIILYPIACWFTIYKAMFYKKMSKKNKGNLLKRK